MSSLLSAFGIQTHLLIAQAINFGVLFAVLSYFLYKPVLKTIDERRALVAKGVMDAREAGLALSEAGEKSRTITHDAETEAEGIVARARTEAGTERDRLVLEAQARAEGIEKDALARAEEAESRLRRESQKDIARLAILAAEKAMRSHASA